MPDLLSTDFLAGALTGALLLAPLAVYAARLVHHLRALREERLRRSGRRGLSRAARFPHDSDDSGLTPTVDSAVNHFENQLRAVWIEFRRRHL